MLCGPRLDRLQYLESTLSLRENKQTSTQMHYYKYVKSSTVLRLNLFALIVMVGGCVVIPESEKEPFLPDQVTKIELGSTNRREIAAEFGSPRFSTEDRRIIAYSEDQVHATLYILAGGPYQATILPIPIFTRHNLVIRFSAEDTVESVEQLPGTLLGHCFSESQCFSAESSFVATRKQAQMKRELIKKKKKLRRTELLPKAEAGDIEAQYKIASLYYQDRKERWYWLCRAANGGHPEAMVMMGSKAILNENKAGKKEKKIALQWFLLAELAGSKNAVEIVRQLSASMHQEEISLVENQLERWKPDPSSCGTLD